jgi:hypothetical protein
VQSSDLPDYLSLDKLKVGQVILFRVKSLPPETSRVIHLSAFPEGECLNESKVELNHLTPGTLIQATAEKFVYDGVFMRLTNGNHRILKDFL